MIFMKSSVGSRNTTNLGEQPLTGCLFIPGLPPMETKKMKFDGSNIHLSECACPSLFLEKLRINGRPFPCEDYTKTPM
jgi:hypothetical protein